MSWEANGVHAATPGQPDNPGNRDPSSDTVDGSITNMMERIDFQWHDLDVQGSAPGDEVPLPPAYTPNVVLPSAYTESGGA